MDKIIATTCLAIFGVCAFISYKLHKERIRRIDKFIKEVDHATASMVKHHSDCRHWVHNVNAFVNEVNARHEDSMNGSNKFVDELRAKRKAWLDEVAHEDAIQDFDDDCESDNTKAFEDLLNQLNKLQEDV